jgi:hypothetical protein
MRQRWIKSGNDGGFLTAGLGHVARGQRRNAARYLVKGERERGKESSEGGGAFAVLLSRQKIGGGLDGEAASMRRKEVGGPVRDGAKEGGAR